MSSDTEQKSTKGRIAIDFIDPLFAVVISLSFSEVMKRPWFSPGTSDDIQAEFVIEILTLFLGYLTVVLSWVGYHQSIATKPIRLESGIGPGFFRFIGDVILLICYWILLVKFQNLWIFLMVLGLIHFVFIIWDQLKWWEYGDSDNSDSRRRRGVTTFWFLLFFIEFLIYWLVTVQFVASDIVDEVFISVGIFFTILYRLHKQWLHPQCVLDILAFHRPERGD